MPAEFLVRYCLEVFPAPDIEVTRQEILDGATPTSALGENHGLYLFLPTANFRASGHCDYYYCSPSLGYYKTVAGNNWQYISSLYFWILE